MYLHSPSSTFAPSTQRRRGIGQDMPISPGQGVAIAGQLITLANQIDNLITSSGCGATCLQATNVVNQAEPILQQNLAVYLAQPVHYQSSQTQALQNFESVWAAVNSACASPSLGVPGANCIGQREQGACAYKTSPGGWQQQNGVWTYVYPGANGSGSTCWNWFVGYYDPIANDPTVVANPAGTEVTGSGASTTSCLSLFSLLGISEPCLGPIGAYTAIVGVVLAAMAMRDL